MSRRHSAEKREIIPDAKYGDIVLTKFMNSIMYEGKKSIAEGIVYGAFDIVENRARANPIEVFRAALENVAPAIEVRSRRVGGATYQVPSKSAPSVVRLWRSVGLSRPPVAATTAPWSSASRPNSSMPRTTVATRSRSGKTRTGWLKPTAPSRTTAGKRPRTLSGAIRCPARMRSRLP